MVHPLAAVGVEASDDETGRAFGAGGMSVGIRAHDGLCRFGAKVFSSFGNLAQRAANADGFIDGGSGASAKTAQYQAARAESVLHLTPAGSAGALGHSDFFSRFAVGTNMGAIEPGRVEELAGLDVESDGDGIFAANGVGRRLAAVATAEVGHHALVRDADASVVESAVTLGILSHGERRKGD